MQINESQIRRIIRKVINDPKKYSLKESAKSRRLEDKIDKVFSNPDADLGDLKLQKLYTTQDQAEMLKSTYSGWVSDVDFLKDKSTEDKRDKKRITNKLQRIQYLIDLVLNPKKAPEEPKKITKKAPEEPKKVAGQSSKKKETSKQSDTNKTVPTKTKNRVSSILFKGDKVKAIQNTVSAPSSQTEKGADGKWGKNTSAAFAKWLKQQDLSKLTQAAAKTNENISRRQLRLMINEVLRTGSIIKEAATDKQKEMIDVNKNNPAAIAKELGYTADLAGIEKLVNTLKSGEDKAKVKSGEDKAKVENEKLAGERKRYEWYKAYKKLWEDLGNTGLWQGVTDNANIDKVVRPLGRRKINVITPLKPETEIKFKVSGTYPNIEGKTPAAAVDMVKKTAKIKMIDFSSSINGTEKGYKIASGDGMTIQTLLDLGPRRVLNCNVDNNATWGWTGSELARIAVYMIAKQWSPTDPWVKGGIFQFTEEGFEQFTKK